jgi:large subunit ribosomal protein L30
MAKKLKVRQTVSDIGKLEKQKQTLRALGLRRIRHERVLPDTPAVRGMIAVVEHLVNVEEIK